MPSWMIIYEDLCKNIKCHKIGIVTDITAININIFILSKGHSLRHSFKVRDMNLQGKLEYKVHKTKKGTVLRIVLFEP